jgi:6-O-methylguanine DNA methyltransferase, DNA binding domain
LRCEATRVAKQIAKSKERRAKKDAFRYALSLRKKELNATKPVSLFGRAVKISQKGWATVLHDEQALACDPVPIVIPYHRVIASDGNLHGYSGGSGLEAKRWLLELEGAL